MMFEKKIWSLALVAVLFSSSGLLGDYLYTVDGQMYEGQMVAFKYNVIFFNVYKFGKFFRLMRFPLLQVWKIEFNQRQKEGLLSPFDIESSYNKFRQGKRKVVIDLPADREWVDTGIDVSIGQEILFSVTGYIYVNENTRVYQNGEMKLNLNQNKPIPNHPTGAVISKVGSKGVPFYVGDDKAPFHMSKKNRLFVGINDFDFKDNSGSFKVTIYY
jgi:hypothetical protein